MQVDAVPESPFSPQTWLDRVGQSVRVCLIDGTNIDGTLYTVDPDTQDIALLEEVRFAAQKPKLH